MKLMAALMLLNLADVPQVEVETIGGSKTVGQVVSVDAAGWTIKADGKDVSLTARSVLSMRLVSGAAPVQKRGDIEVELIDGAKLGVSKVALMGKAIEVESSIVGKMTIPRTAVASVRLMGAQAALVESWKGLLERDKKQDMLVTSKGVVLDFYEGVIGKMTDEKVNFLLDDTSIGVPRNKVFGLIFHHRTEAGGPKPSASIEFINGDKLLLRQASSDGEVFNLTTATGGKLSVPINQVKSVDMSYGKLKWLSSLEPRDVKHEYRFIDVGAAYEVNEDVYGGRLRIGNSVYNRGISIRSRTEVRYRLDGDYNRFQTWVGIQKGYAGDVNIVISVDGKPIHKSVVKQGTPPVRLDLEVGGKYSMEILVDYGTVKSDIGDHLVLGDAVLLK